MRFPVFSSTLLLLAAATLFSTPLIAQTERNTSSGEPNAVVIEPLNMNVLYIGVDNPLAIMAEGVQSKELTVRFTDNGSIEYKSGNEFVARVSQPGVTYLEVYNGNQLIGKRTYRIKRIPDPTPTVGGSLRGGKATREELLQHSGLEAILEQYEGPGACTVKGYTATIVPRQEEPIRIEVTGQAFPQELIDKIRSLPERSAVLFDNIKVKCPGDPAARNIGSLTFAFED